jgi:6-phosphogluconolactonase (cycloisomerase 2 family)
MPAASPARAAALRGVRGPRRAAQLQYGSNRGHDSIVTFSIDAATGKITYLGTTPSGGTVPRSFTLSADGKLMLVANESGEVVSFSVDVTSGALTKLLTVKQTNKPQFVGIVTLPGAAP